MTRSKSPADFLSQAIAIRQAAEVKFSAMRGWVMQMEEGAEGQPATTEETIPEDLTGLKKALVAERNRAKEVEKQAKETARQFKAIQDQFKDLDPDKYAEMQRRQEALDQLEAETAKYKAQIEEDFQRQLAAVNKEREAANLQLQSFRKQVEIEKAFASSEGRMDGHEGETYFSSFYASYGNRFKMAEDGTLYVEVNGKREYDKDGKLKTPAEYMKELRANPVTAIFFNPERKGGTGMSADQGGRFTQRRGNDELKGAERVARAFG